MAETLVLAMTAPEPVPGTAPTPADVKAIQDKHPLLGTWSKLWEEVYGFKRAFVIEFAGMPKAGKSGTIDEVRHFFSYGHNVKVSPKGRPYVVHTPAEGVSQRTPRVLKDDKVDYNTWAGAYALQELIEARHDRYHDLVILDRGPWDAGCWLQHLKLNPPANDRKMPADKIAEFFQLSCWGTESDLHVVMVVEPAKAAGRESQRLIEHKGPAANGPLMTSMMKIYSESFDKLLKEKSEECKNVGKWSAILLNTTSYKEKNRAAEFEIISRALKILELKIQDLKKDTADTLLQSVPGMLSGRVRGEKLPIVAQKTEELRARLKPLSPLQRFDFRQDLTKRIKDFDLILSARGEVEIITRGLDECFDQAATS